MARRPGLARPVNTSACRAAEHGTQLEAPASRLSRHHLVLGHLHVHPLVDRVVGRVPVNRIGGPLVVPLLGRVVVVIRGLVVDRLAVEFVGHLVRHQPLFVVGGHEFLDYVGRFDVVGLR